MSRTLPSIHAAYMEEAPGVLPPLQKVALSPQQARRAAVDRIYNRPAERPKLQLPEPSPPNRPREHHPRGKANPQLKAIRRLVDDLHQEEDRQRVQQYQPHHQPPQQPHQRSPRAHPSQHSQPQQYQPEQQQHHHRLRPPPPPHPPTGARGRAARPLAAGAPGRTRTRLEMPGDTAAQTGTDPSSRPPKRPDRSDGSVRSVPRNPNAASKRTDPLAAFGYRTTGPIAAGAFSTVVRARRATGGGEVAVKSFAKAKYAKAGWLKTALKNELEVLQLLRATSHAHVANLLELHEAPNATHAILEYCSGGSVHRHLKSLRHGEGFAEAFGGLLTAQLALALAHLHENGVCHRDVKPENVLYSDASRTSIKLCDFGFAVVCGDRKLRTVCGSPAYMAPELSTREAYHGPPVDLWALGCFAFEVLQGIPPFRGESLDSLNLRIKRVDHAPFKKTLSSEGRKLIKRLLVADAQARLPAAEAAAAWKLVAAAAAEPEAEHSRIPSD